MSFDSDKLEVRITDIRMPFESMVVFMVKWAIASIPVLIILFVLGALLWAGFFAFHSRPAPKVSLFSNPMVERSPRERSHDNSKQLAYLSKVLVSNVSVGDAELRFSLPQSYPEE